MKLKDFIYLRVSTEEQAKEGLSIDYQNNRLKQYSKDTFGQVINTYKDEGKSGKLELNKVNISFPIDGSITINIDPKRKEFVELLKQIQTQKPNRLLVTVIDRLARSNLLLALIQTLIEQNKTKLEPSDDTKDKMGQGFMGIMAQKESEEKSRRTKQANESRFDKGLHLAKPPLGYTQKGKNKTAKPNNFSETIKQIFQQRTKGSTITQIAKQHNLDPKTISNILKNKFYYGILEYQGKEKKGLHQPIINQDSWEKAN